MLRQLGIAIKWTRSAAAFRLCSNPYNDHNLVTSCVGNARWHYNVIRYCKIHVIDLTKFRQYSVTPDTRALVQHPCLTHFWASSPFYREGRAIMKKSTLRIFAYLRKFDGADRAVIKSTLTGIYEIYSPYGLRAGVKSDIWFLVFGLLCTENNNLCLGNLRATRYSTDFPD